jgi:hypothetical protein
LQEIADGAIGSLCNPIQFRGVRRARLVRDSCLREIFGEVRGDILPAVVGPQGGNGETPILFKGGAKKFEAQENI